jgi:hypothetical protein
MRIPLTDELVAQARRFDLRSSCPHCFFYVGARCALEWPEGEQLREPIDAPNADGSRPATTEWCKEFELR